MQIYESRCSTCTSEHREEIEAKKIEEDWSLRKISRWLEKQYGEKISPQALGRHFEKHLMDNLERAVQSEIRTREVASKEVTQTLNLIDELRGSIAILKKMLNRLLDLDKREGDVSTSRINALTKCLTETRLTIKELNSLTGSLEISGIREDDVKEEFFSQFADKVDPDVAKLVLEAWEETEEEIDES